MRPYSGGRARETSTSRDATTRARHHTSKAPPLTLNSPTPSYLLLLLPSAWSSHLPHLLPPPTHPLSVHTSRSSATASAEHTSTPRAWHSAVSESGATPPLRHSKYTRPANRNAKKGEHTCGPHHRDRAAIDARTGTNTVETSGQRDAAEARQGKGRGMHVEGKGERTSGTP